MRLQAIYIALISALSLLTNAALPKPKDVTIGRAEASGSGCSSSSVSLSVSPNRTDLAFTLSQFGVAIGVAKPPTERMKGCTIQVVISYPPGFAISFVNTTYRGKATLPRGATANFTSDLRFLGYGLDMDDGRYSTVSAQVVGGDDGLPEYTTWVIAQETRAGYMCRAPCCGNVTLNIMTRVRLSAALAGVEADLGYHEESPGFLLQLRLGWETC
ncbi:hypothetical protein OQA88_1772 [Cercophora sp. LCS_1]